MKDREAKIVQRLMAGAASGEKKPLPVTDEELGLLVDGALAAPEAARIQAAILSDPEARRRLAALREAQDAQDDGVADLSPASLQRALGLIPGAREVARLAVKPDWLTRLTDWLAGLLAVHPVAVPVTATMAAAFVLGIVFFLHEPDFGFRGIKALSQAQLAAVLPPETPPLSFTGSSVIEELWPMRVGYAAALIRDLAAAGKEAEASVVEKLMLGHVPGTQEPVLTLIRAGRYPCRVLPERQGPLCEAGATVYQLLRDDAAPSQQQQARLAQALVPVSDKLGETARQRITSLPPALTKDDLRDLVARIF